MFKYFVLFAYLCCLAPFVFFWGWQGLGAAIVVSLIVLGLLVMFGGEDFFTH